MNAGITPLATTQYWITPSVLHFIHIFSRLTFPGNTRTVYIIPGISILIWTKLTTQRKYVQGRRLSNSQQGFTKGKYSPRFSVGTLTSALAKLGLNETELERRSKCTLTFTNLICSPVNTLAGRFGSQTLECLPHVT